VVRGAVRNAGDVGVARRVDRDRLPDRGIREAAGELVRIEHGSRRVELRDEDARRDVREAGAAAVHAAGEVQVARAVDRDGAHYVVARAAKVRRVDEVAGRGDLGDPDVETTMRPLHDV